jgi:hypothetical protein
LLRWGAGTLAAARPHRYLAAMRISKTDALMLPLAALLAVASAHQADARTKHRVQAASSSAESAFWSGLSVPVENGTPVIMRNFHPSKAGSSNMEPGERRSVRVPRGSSSYIDIPPSVPSRNSANSPPAAALAQPIVQPYKPPPIVTPGDKAIDAIHAFPLQGGIGNNPTNQQEFIRQRVNQ